MSDMKNSEKFEHLCERMLSYVTSADVQTATSPCELNFTGLCRQEGLSETVAENLCYAHFGLSPENLMRHIGFPKNAGIC
jgi:hypothetical protein